jgi:hypothetical protein
MYMKSDEERNTGVPRVFPFLFVCAPLFSPLSKEGDHGINSEHATSAAKIVKT